jgi:radical SAM superfamily enzyme YgiQ (UPF0313 family)
MSAARPDPSRLKRLLLIAPTALDSSGRPITQRRLYLPALTLPHLAALTPPAFHIRLVYETIEPIPFTERWDLVGLTGMGSGVARAWQIADEFRRRGVPTVIGGIAASLGRPEWTLAHADSLVVGDAEQTWPRLLEDFRGGRLQPIYRSDSRPDLTDLPRPRYDLMNRRRMGRWLPVQATRGCPFTCRFCSVTAFHEQSYRKRPVDQVIDDVRHARRLGIRHIAFVDDNLVVDTNFAMKLFDALVPEKIIWMSQVGLHVADNPDLLRLAHRSGARMFSIGIESTSPESLAEICKEWNSPGRYDEAIRTIRAHGIDVSTEMIVGFDHDDPGVFDRTLEFIEKNSISVPRVHILTPVPGTPLYEDLERDGRLLTREFDRFSGGRVVFQPNAIDADELQKRYWRLNERLFSWRSMIRRAGFNRARLSPFMRAVVIGTNLHYRNHVHRRISPGIV